MNGSSEGSPPSPATAGRSAASRSPSRSHSSSGEALEDLALLGRHPLQQDLVDPRQRVAHGLAALGALDQGGHLHQLDVAGDGLVHVEVGVEPHLAQAPANAGHRVEQLVAHDPEGRVEALGRSEQLLLEHLLLRFERRARLLVERRRLGRGARRAALGPGQDEPLARARHRHVQQPAHLVVVRLTAVGVRERLLEQRIGHLVVPAARGTRHPAGRQSEHEHVVELEPLGGVHGHHAHGRRGRRRHGLLLAQPGLGDRRQVAGELARSAVRLAAHVGARELRQLGDVAQALDGVGLGGEHLLAPQPDPLHQPQHERVRAAVLERRRRGAVEAQEGLGPVAPLGRELRPLERGDDRRRHVELAPPRQLGEPRDVHRVQLDRRPRQRAHHGAGVGGVGQGAQPGQHVAHLGALVVGGGARGAERQRPLLERGGDHRGLVLHRAHEHADLRGRHTTGHEPLGLGGHRLRLRALALRAPEAHLAAAAAGQRLVDPPGRRRHHRAGGVEYALARAVVALEPDHGRVRQLALEVAQVLLRGAAEAVDRLVVVADHGHVAVLLHQQPQQHPLGEVGVLVLVHEHVAEARGGALAHVRLLVQQAEGAQDQVAEVERPALAEQAVVVGVEAAELELARGVRSRGVVVRPLGQPLRVRDVVVGRHHLVLQAVDPRHEAPEQRRRVAADLVVAQRELVDAVEQQRQAIRRRDRREERIDAGFERLVGQQARAEAVEGLHVELLVGRGDERLEPLAHLGGGRRGEGQREQLLGGRPLLDEPAEAPADRAGLAGAGTRHDQERTPRVRHSGTLSPVQGVLGFRHPALGYAAHASQPR